MRHTPRRLIATAASPLLLSLVVACGSDDPDPTAATTSSSPSASPSASTSPTEPAAEPSITVPTGPVVPLKQADEPGELVDPKDFSRTLATATGEATTAKMVMDLSNETGPVLNVAGDVDYRSKTPAMSLRLTVAAYGDQPIDLRLVDGQMYMQAPMLDASGKFYKVDTTDPNDPLAGSLGDLSNFDPQATLDAFSKDLEAVTYRGTETIAGEETRHFEVIAKSQSLPDELTGQTGELPELVAYDLWIGPDNRMRRLQTALGDADMTLRMSGWGDPVSIEAPPKSMIAKLPGR